MKKATLFVIEQAIQSEHRFLSSVKMEGGKSISLFAYEFADTSLSGTECEVIVERGSVIKLLIDGKEYPKKESEQLQEKSEEQMSFAVASDENERASRLETTECLEPEVNKREAYAYWHACKRVSEGVDKYSEQVSKIPMLIKHNGLGAALMYMRTQKTRNALSDIYEDITDWISHDEKQLIELGNGEELAEKIIEIGQEQYRDVTREVLAYLAFLKRFAKGLSQ